MLLRMTLTVGDGTFKFTQNLIYYELQKRATTFPILSIYNVDLVTSSETQ